MGGGEMEKHEPPPKSELDIDPKRDVWLRSLRTECFYWVDDCRYHHGRPRDCANRWNNDSDPERLV
jgi:hypothetical protein